MKTVKVQIHDRHMMTDGSTMLFAAMKEAGLDIKGVEYLQIVNERLRPCAVFHNGRRCALSLRAEHYARDFDQRLPIPTPVTIRVKIP